MSIHNRPVKEDAVLIHAALALLPDGWAREVRLVVQAGRIVEVTPGADPQGERVGLLLPAPVNLHSHTFQRAMAGLTERRTAGQDSFWTWRSLMYRFLDQLTPDEVQAIAALAMVEMAEAGYAAVAEFHYLHHAPGGAPYANRAEMAARIAAAAAETGLGLTLLPVAYAQGGCDGRALAGGQLRFGNDLDGFAAVLQGAGQAVAALPTDARLGVAPHSLRAVPREMLARMPELAAGGPIHMHIAEQVAEVDEVQAAWGARPVDWACANLPLGPQWCLIHATQMTPRETAALAATGAVAGLCPETEANLGDGIFDGPGWFEAGGVWGLGTDSNIRISLMGEARMLEYSQRLAHRARAVLATEDASCGRVLLEGAARGGAQAAGRDAGEIRVGAWADLMVPSAALVQGREGDEALDTLVFAAPDAPVDSLWSAGRRLVTQGRHHARDAVEARFAAVMAALRARL
ncbi:MAG: formimidoylglutamate deiminase [Fuscovulum sp.]|nr:formimidoylglutamate deiminase [Fuscovulum sp.]